MTQTYSKSRQRAEIAFGETQSQFISRRQSVAGPSSEAQLQAEKTMRLRESRLAKQGTAASASTAKRGG